MLFSKCNKMANSIFVLLGFTTVSTVRKLHGGGGGWGGCRLSFPCLLRIMEWKAEETRDSTETLRRPSSYSHIELYKLDRVIS